MDIHIAGSLSVISVAPKLGLYTYIQCLMKQIGTVAVCNLDSGSGILARRTAIIPSVLVYSWLAS